MSDYISMFHLKLSPPSLHFKSNTYHAVSHGVVCSLVRLNPAHNALFSTSKKPDITVAKIFKYIKQSLFPVYMKLR